VSDVTNMGRWSPETDRAEWLDGATGPAVGARFRGHNQRGFLKYWTKCTIVASEPGREFAFVVGTAEKPLTRWGFLLEPSGVGTDVTESWKSMSDHLLAKAFVPKKRRRTLDTGMRKTLERLKSAAESGGTVGS
jgi:Polyketide cyclase / dehydrase and lipid transport